MPDLDDGAWVKVQGSARAPYVLKNVAGVYSCSCPAWRNQSLPIDQRTCKHLRALRGEAAEAERLGNLPPVSKTRTAPQAPALLLAETWDHITDLAGWWMSEKLDGVRAYWDGQQFLSRQGNVFQAPDWFKERLPSVPLDGELWVGRRAFQRTVSIVRRQVPGPEWRQVRYLVFDLPACSAPFEERLKQLEQCPNINSDQAVVSLVSQVRCQGPEDLRAEMARITALGGEGLMLREPGSRYEPRRSPTLLKVKTFHDAEARVVEHLPGAGRHRGRLGALLVELPSGIHFSVGSGLTDSQREQPPAIGSQITFRYQELSDRGVPRFPTFVRVRPGEGPTLFDQTNAGGHSAGPTIKEPTMRRFEFVEGNSSKFWEVNVQGSNVQVRYGRIGTAGQSMTKSFPAVGLAQIHAERLIRQKTAKGYREEA